jgi:membrane protease YdiL (CAAX protease family)
MFLSTGLAFLVAGWRGRRRRPDPRWRPAAGGALPRFALGLGAGALLVLLTEGVSRLLAALGLEPAEQGLVVAVVEAGGWTLGLFAAVAVLLAPAAEELFFRGHVFRTLAPRTSRGTAYGVTALLFAGIHLNPAALPLYVLYSLGLSWLYERTRSLLVPTLAHGVVNAVAVATLALS